MKDLTVQERANVRYNIVNSTFLYVTSKRIIPFIPIIRILMQEKELIKKWKIVKENKKT
jgi:hypothetical protein